MPEGDTVWLTADKLHRALAGSQLARTDFRLPQLATTDLSGRSIAEVVARGKHILIRTTDSLTLHSHLRMDGSWSVTSADGRRLMGRTHPAHHLRVALTTERVTARGYRVHDVAIVPTDRESELVGHLGPDLLGPDWSAPEAARRLAAEPARMIGPALLDQRNLAGIGNLYKCELLFLRGVSPWAPVSSVDLPPMVELGHRLLVSNRDRWEQVTTGVNRPGQTTYVYGRAGKPCRRCGRPIQRIDQHEPGKTRHGDPTARSTYWCPRCQPEPEH